MLPPTPQRVPRHTAEDVNDAIYRDTVQRIRQAAIRGREAIDERLRELDEEWDIERTLEANAATLALAGVGLGALDRRFLILPAVVTGFLLQHALQGWCPPVPVFRRLGFRTAAEIDFERDALRALRGDLSVLSGPEPADRDTRIARAITAAAR